MNRKRMSSLLGAVFALTIALWPRAASADQCEFTNPGACIDGSVYSFYRGIAVMVWSLDRTLLVLAYQLDYLRWWLVTQMFGRLFESVRTVAEPFLTPLATVAVIVGLLLFLLVPVVGRVNLINIRQIFVLIMIVPMLLASAASWFLEAEGWRSEIAGAITEQIGQISAQNMFGGANSSEDAPMAVIKPIYAPYGGPGACAAVPVTRPPIVSSTGTPNGIHLDDLAAALLLANAQDLHCPGEQGSEYMLPDGFSAGEVFTVDGQIETRSPSERARAIEMIQRGITRLLLGIGACVLAVFEYLVQLIFSLAIMTLWLVLPFVLLFMLFQDSLALLGSLIRHFARVCITSWIVSVLIGMLGGLLASAANTGSATAYISLSFGEVFILIRLFVIAVDVLKETFTQTIGGTLGMAGAAFGGTTAQLGRLTRQGGHVVGSAVGLARATAAAGTRAAVTGAIAARTTGNARYAFGAAVGTFRPLAQVGAVAASMGFVGDEISSGLYSGERSARTSYGAAARQMQSDTRRPLADGSTIRDRARKRAVEKQLNSAERPTLLEYGEETVQRATHAPGSTLAPAGLRSELVQAGDRLIDSIQSGHARLQSGTRATETPLSQPNGVQDSAGDTAQAPEVALEQSVKAGALVLVGGADTLYQRGLSRRPGARRYQAQRLDTNGKLHWSDATPPADALLVPAAAIRDRAGILVAGYTVQNQRNGQVAIWSDTPEAPVAVSASAPAAERRRASLIKAGYLTAQSTHDLSAQSRTADVVIDSPPPAAPIESPGESQLTLHNDEAHQNDPVREASAITPGTSISASPPTVETSASQTGPATIDESARTPEAAAQVTVPEIVTQRAPVLRRRRNVVIPPDMTGATQQAMPLDEHPVPGVQQASAGQPAAQPPSGTPQAAVKQPAQQPPGVPASVLKSPQQARQRPPARTKTRKSRQ